MLSRLLVRVPDEAAAKAVQDNRAQILEELNVKRLELVARDAELVSYRIKPNLPRIGKRLGKLVPAVRRALGDADSAAIAAAVAANQDFELDVDGRRLGFDADDVLIETTAAEGYACAEEGGYLAGLDTRLDDELRTEGVARELVRTVQEARKQAGLEVDDRITLRVHGSDGVAEALAKYRGFLMSETLATAWGGEDFAGTFSCEHQLEGHRWAIALARVDA